jgi:hypothetical protein
MKQPHPKTYFHAIFKDNPHKGGIINITTDVPVLPRQYREKMGEADIK